MRIYRLITGNRAYADRFNEKPLKGPDWRMEADVDEDGDVAGDRIVLKGPDGEPLHEGPILLDTRMRLESQIRMAEAGHRIAAPPMPEASVEVAASVEPAKPASPEAKEGARAARQVGQAPKEVPVPEASDDWIREIQLGRIAHFPGGNIRERFDGLDELAESIRAHGIMQPLTVNQRDGQYVLIAGERRYRAAGLAGLPTVPCRVMRLDDKAALELMLVENIQRRDLNPMEEAKAFRRLMDLPEATQVDVAKRVGKSRPHVNEMLQLLQLPESLQHQVAAGTMAVKVALKFLRETRAVPDIVREKLAEDMAREQPSTRQADRVIDRSLEQQGVARATPPVAPVVEPGVLDPEQTNPKIEHRAPDESRTAQEQPAPVAPEPAAEPEAAAIQVSRAIKVRFEQVWMHRCQSLLTDLTRGEFLSELLDYWESDESEMPE